MIDGWFTWRQGKPAGCAFSFLPEAQSIPFTRTSLLESPFELLPLEFFITFSTVKYEHIFKNVLI